MGSTPLQTGQFKIDSWLLTFQEFNQQDAVSRRQSGQQKHKCLNQVLLLAGFGAVGPVMQS